MAVLHALCPPEVRLLPLLFVLPSLLPSTSHPSRAPRPWLCGPLRAAVGSEGVSLLHSRQPVAAPKFPGHRRPTSGVFSFPKRLSARSLISELSRRKGAGAAVRRAKRLLSCYLARVCVSIHLRMGLSLRGAEAIWKGSPEKACPIAFHLPPSPPPSLPVILSALPFGVALAAGRSHVPPPFFLHSAPPRYVRFRNGLAFTRLGMTAGWVGGGPARVSEHAGVCSAGRV